MPQLQALKSKLHTVRVTESIFDYEGSLGVDIDILEAADMKVYEKVLVANFTTGYRYETYLIPQPAGSKTISLNGGGARYALVGDTLTIMSFRLVDEGEAIPKPKVLIFDEHNNFVVKDN